MAIRQAPTWLLVLALGISLAVPALDAQLVIGAPSYPEFKLPPPDEEIEKEQEKPPPPSFSGDPVVVPPNCEVERLERAGMICSDERPCEIFLELTAVAPTGGKVVVVGNLHSRDATLESLLLVGGEEDGEWVQTADRIPAANLERVQFFDKDHGWAGGHQGDDATGERPFLLATRNGGETWREWPVMVRGVQREGVLAELLFDSAKHGYVILRKRAAAGDPYELYETSNGGRSWSVRQISAERPEIPGKRLRGVAAPTWRIGADAESSDYLVERMSDDSPTGWRVVSRFSSRSGACASPPVSQTETGPSLGPSLKLDKEDGP